MTCIYSRNFLLLQKEHFGVRTSLFPVVSVQRDTTNQGGKQDGMLCCFACGRYSHIGTCLCDYLYWSYHLRTLAVDFGPVYFVCYSWLIFWKVICLTHNYKHILNQLH